jgi:hypothetical protein
VAPVRVISEFVVDVQAFPRATRRMINSGAIAWSES